MADRWRYFDLRERRDPAASGRAQRGAVARRSAPPQRVIWNGCSRRSIPSRWQACPGRSSCSPATPTRRRERSAERIPHGSAAAPGAGAGGPRMAGGRFLHRRHLDGGCAAPGRSVGGAQGLSRLPRLSWRAPRRGPPLSRRMPTRWRFSRRRIWRKTRRRPHDGTSRHPPLQCTVYRTELLRLPSASMM